MSRITCQIVHLLAPEDWRVANSPTVAVSQCQTHDWAFGRAPVHESGLCPLGRIEQATEDAIARIKAAGQ